MKSRGPKWLMKGFIGVGILIAGYLLFVTHPLLIWCVGGAVLGYGLSLALDAVLRRKG